MSDQEIVGTPWRDDELDSVIADYFSMLEAELSGRPYVKAQHSASLMARIGRTHGSIEFKHQNISAVLEELGLPWIFGYKPMKNYQSAIFDAIDRYLSLHKDLLNHVPAALVLPKEDDQVFVDRPLLTPEEERPPRLQKLIKKFDPVERDHLNRTLGQAGEAFVLELERRRLLSGKLPDLASKVRWISAEEGDGAGYDIRSFDDTGQDRLIEVKTTNGSARTPFFLSRNERGTAESRPESWRLYRVHLFNQNPRIFTISPPLEAAVHLQTETWRGSF